MNEYKELDQKILDYLYDHCEYEKLTIFNPETILGGRYDSEDYKDLNPTYGRWLIEQCIHKLEYERKRHPYFLNEYIESFMKFVNTQPIINQQYANLLMEERKL